MKSPAEKDAESGTLTAMLEGYCRDVLDDMPIDDASKLSSMMDFNGGACGALTLIDARMKAGEDPAILVRRLLAECMQIHEHLNPDLHRKTRQ